ncbi:adenylate/guanylate cyclase domain-containing protein [Marinobacter sp. CHS3-4]|uniref:adenylate/guanylate cyclase domain-containing protein n=1 Tax=Marinobacter sp. CHS3-4 TaxID=3045174 RepID=UPI0024B582DF|nr:adenylate/guanylate cyclase domain-containing protein [Marinobacter sp. CHS3-4]MDI9245950.1 adenylate/guanylate cyclase domain-containing protein [Marinobacter sp. CHS3-4]
MDNDNRFDWISPRPLLILFLTSVVAALVWHFTLGYRLDRPLHDAISVAKPRLAWQHAGVVAVDDGVPLQVGRTQMLPLFSRATETLVAAGASGVFLDARVPLTVDSRLPFAECIESSGRVRWSQPRCTANSGTCGLMSSRAGRRGPLSMDSEAFERFYYAPPHIDTDPPRYWALFGRSVSADRAADHVGRDELVVPDDPGLRDGVSRWLSHDPDHAINRLVAAIDPDVGRQSEEEALTQASEPCEVSGQGKVACSRVRQGPFVADFSFLTGDDRSLIPLSTLAQCDTGLSPSQRSRIEGKVFILQASSPLEPIDFHNTPMTTAFNGDAKLTAGPQFLADAIETRLYQDHPRLLQDWAAMGVYLIGLLLALLVLYRFSIRLAFLVPPLIAGVLFAIGYFSFPALLLPIVGPTLAAALLVGLVVVFQRNRSMREARIVSGYLPSKVRDVVLREGVSNMSFSQKTACAVLISDIAGYTRFTSLVQNPEIVFREINRYLDAVTQQVQSDCEAWLEGYTGDEVCFYWPEKYDADARYNALRAALVLNRLQKEYFQSMGDREYALEDEQVQAHIKSGMRAGIGLAFGDLTMGNIGPEKGIKKFGILGDPLNLSSRLEGLTRKFSSDIIASHQFINAAAKLDIATRRLACVKVKGRSEAETIYALGERQDERFNPERVAKWEAWLAAIEQSGEWVSPEPGMGYEADVETIQSWLERGLLRPEEGVWYLDEK